MSSYVRPVIEKLNAYRVTPPDYEIVVNANECPWDIPTVLKEEICQKIMAAPLNRYPDAGFRRLLTALSNYTGYPEDHHICGNGSDELVAMLYQTFVSPGEITVSHSPGFAMYGIWAEIAGATFLDVPDTEEGIPDTKAMIDLANTRQAKMIFICNPNNPTGYLFSREEVIEIIDNTQSLVVLDEAYMEFHGSSMGDLIDIYPERLIIMRTLSKAFGLASLRCGYCLGNPKLIDYLYKVKAPYNINSLTQIAAEIVLNNRDLLKERLVLLKDEKCKINDLLQCLPDVQTYPAASNFIYFKTPKAEAIYNTMEANNILIRYFPDDRAIRLTIGSPEENKKIAKILKEVCHDQSCNHPS